MADGLCGLSRLLVQPSSQFVLTEEANGRQDRRGVRNVDTTSRSRVSMLLNPPLHSIWLFAFVPPRLSAMGKKGKRASSDGSSGGADTSRRRSTGPPAEEKLRQTRVAGPAVLPPTQDKKNKRCELDLVSKRVYQETILRCVQPAITSSKYDG